MWRRSVPTALSRGDVPSHTPLSWRHSVPTPLSRGDTLFANGEGARGKRSVPRPHCRRDIPLSIVLLVLSLSIPVCVH